MAADQEDSPEQQAEDSQLMQLIARFKEGLDAVEQQIFSLRFAEERDQEATAAAVGLSVYKVRKLERKLRRRMPSHLKKHGYLTDAESTLMVASVLGGLL